MTAAEIAAACGGARCSGEWWRCVCPVHGSRTGRSLTLALRDGDRGLIVHCHAGCGREDILAALRRIGLLAGRSDDARLPPVRPRSDDRADPARRTAWARRIWESWQGHARDPVMRYFAACPHRHHCGGCRRCAAETAPAGQRWSRGSMGSTARWSACTGPGSTATCAGSGITVSEHRWGRSPAAPCGSQRRARC